MVDFFNDGLLDVCLIDDESGDWTKDIICQGWVRVKNVEMEEDELIYWVRKVDEKEEG